MKFFEFVKNDINTQYGSIINDMKSLYKKTDAYIRTIYKRLGCRPIRIVVNEHPLSISIISDKTILVTDATGVIKRYENLPMEQRIEILNAIIEQIQNVEKTRPSHIVSSGYYTLKI